MCKVGLLEPAPRCPPGWTRHAHHCSVLQPDRLGRGEAGRACAALGAQLPHPAPALASLYPAPLWVTGPSSAPCTALTASGATRATPCHALLTTICNKSITKQSVTASDDE